MTTKRFWVDALERALKTFLQTLLALLGADQVNLFNSNIDFVATLQVSASAAVISIITSLISGLTPPAGTAGFMSPPST